jgi:hypothetical protein
MNTLSSSITIERKSAMQKALNMVEGSYLSVFTSVMSLKSSDYNRLLSKLKAEEFHHMTTAD